MPSALARQFTPAFSLRPGAVADIADLLALERQVFATDQMSRRSFRHFLISPGAALIVLDRAGLFSGYALALFHPRSAAARLYSIAVAPTAAGQGGGSLLLGAAEEAAREGGYASMRLEVHIANASAVACYRKAGYRVFGRRTNYYGDGADALRFHKALCPPPVV